NADETARSIDFRPGIDEQAAMARALTSAASNIDGQMKRVFYPFDGPRFFDWPNQGGSGGGQYADPWRLWFDQNDMVCMTAFVTGGVSIPLNTVFLEPVNSGPPYTYMELDRSSNAAFGGNSQTPQHSLVPSGTWGYGADADQVAALAADVSSGTATVVLSDGSQAGVGDLLILGYGRGPAPFPSALGYAGAIQPYLGERVLVTAKAAADTGLAQSGSGCTTEVDSDQALTWTGTGGLNTGEVVVLDQEQMLVEQVIGTTATVRRAWNGTTLAAHTTGAEIFACRSLTVWRAQLGTAPSSYTTGAAVHKHRVPSLIRDLSIAEAVNQVLQEGSGYARTVGSGESEHPAPGMSLADKWDEARTRHGRKARTRAV
ncbi:MAG TPA: hypothetical protein VIZ43_16855, partial [Trebonia sp.]